MSGQVRMFEPQREIASFDGALEDAMTSVVQSGEYILGPTVLEFEAAAAAWLDVPYALGVGNGTDALWVALRAAGVGPGDLVLTSPFTFFATASAILTVGAEPVFADIDAATFNLEPESVREVMRGENSAFLRRGLSPSGIKAIMPVHLFGQSANLFELSAVASEFGLSMIGDAAQAFGAKYGERRIGGTGEATCFSFFPTKNLGTAGDGGLVTTASPEMASQMAAIRAHGSTERYRHTLVGTNSRLDAIHAAMLRVKLPFVEGWINARRATAQQYTDAFAEVADRVTPPTEEAGICHSYNQYTVRVQHTDRESFRRTLGEEGVDSAVYYPIPVHLQGAIPGYLPGDFPVAEAACESVLSLPVHPFLRPDEVERVTDAVRRACR